MVDFSWWVLLPLPYLWDLFETVSLEYIPSHFSLQACYRNFFVLSFPACGRLSVFLHCIIDSMNCFSRSWVFWIAINVWRLGLFWYPSNLTLVSSMSWTQIWILPPHNIYYFLGSWYTPSSCFLAQHMLSLCSLIRFSVCQKYALIILKLRLFETGK